MYAWIKSFTILGYIALLICYGTLWVDSYGDAIAILVLLVLTLVGIIIITKTSEDSERDFLVTIFLLGFLLRASFSTIVYNTELLGILAGEDDWAGYAGGAYLFYSWMKMPMPSWVPADYISGLLGTGRGYWYLAGSLFYILGSPSQTSLGYMNCFFGALTVILIYKMAKLLFGKDSAIITAKYAVLFPSLVLWSVLTLKEPMVLFLECLIMYLAICLRACVRSIDWPGYEHDKRHPAVGVSGVMGCWGVGASPLPQHPNPPKPSYQSFPFTGRPNFLSMGFSHTL